jgi:hypothetical protein
VEPDTISAAEPEWLRHRIERFQTILRFVSDERAVAELERMLAEAQERLARLMEDRGSNGGSPPA